MYTNLDDAEHDLQVGIQETIADLGDDVSEDDVAHDLVVAFAWEMSDDLAREWCRTQIGSIPFDLQARLGKMDWIV